jgi:ferrous iron transport protein B
MSCSARLPVYALLIAFLTPKNKLWLAGIALSSIYILSILASLLIAAIINKFQKKIIKTEDASSFILELPTYRMPRLKNVLRNTFENAKLYIFRAGPIILILSMTIWFLTYFPNDSPKIDTNGLSDNEIAQLIKSERLSSSYASYFGKFIQPVMRPLGMDWRIGVSLIAGFTAREVFVSSLAMIFKVTDDNNLQSSIISAMRNAKNEETGKPLFTESIIIGLIVFFIFAMQCLSTIAVAKKETGGWRIPILQVLIFTSTAYILTLLTVNLMRLTGFN